VRASLRHIPDGGLDRAGFLNLPGGAAVRAAGRGPDQRVASGECTAPEGDLTMSTTARFLMVEDAYPGYCQICHEPRVVGRITVTGWPYSGLVRTSSSTSDDLDFSACYGLGTLA